jgi:hypothetical protein
MRHEARGAYYSEVLFVFRPGLFRITSIELLDSELYSSVQSIEFNCGTTCGIYHMAMLIGCWPEWAQREFFEIKDFGRMPGLKHVYLHRRPSLRQDLHDALLTAFVRRMFQNQKLLVHISESE